jgi:hypothetical protein
MKYLFLLCLTPIICHSMPVPKNGKWLTVITHYENGVEIDQMKILSAFEKTLPTKLKTEGMDKLKASGITKKGTEVCFDEDSITKQVKKQNDKCKVRIIEDTPNAYKSLISCDNGITSEKYFELKDDKTLNGTVRVLDAKGIEIKRVTSASTFVSSNCESLKPL